MKIAILADIHGNAHGLEAILEDIEREKPDVVVSAGDLIGCSLYPHSPQVWRTLRALRIPKVLGNQEEFVVTYHQPDPHPLIQTSVQFRPTQYVARQFTETDVDEMKALSMHVTLEGPDGQNVLICHAAPHTLQRSIAETLDERMASELAKVSASAIVGGHLHKQWHRHWGGKLLILAGGGGLPLQGEHVAEYLLLTYRKKGWQFRYKTLPFDYRAALDAVLASPSLEQSGPIGWLMLDELLVQQDRLMPFFGQYCARPYPASWDGWAMSVIGYLKHLGRWEVVEPYLTARGIQLPQTSQV
jgi:predicted phosphodiesterase